MLIGHLWRGHKCHFIWHTYKEKNATGAQKYHTYITYVLLVKLCVIGAEI